MYEFASFTQGIEAITNSEASTVIGRGEAVCVDGTNSVFPRWDYSTAGTDNPGICVIKAKRIASSSSVGFLGVAMENIAVGFEGRIATAGSIVAVKCINPPTSNAAGSIAGSNGSPTAGSVDGSATYVVGKKLGTILIPAGTSAGQSGSVTQLIALVASG